uniref:ALA-interacting subunit n=1 Tax=Ananas comosus var. bracteatus TaxID=296719 RepID=A0A6V7PLC5_ANACO|nr:unnamed protein product [Ananas comosus var. bracteatus]
MMNHTGASATGSSSGLGEGANPRRNSKRPKYSKSTQQELLACKPILTPQWVISVFILVGVIFVPIGIAALLASNNVVEIVDRYDAACVPNNMTNDKLSYIQNKAIDKTCTRVLTVMIFRFCISLTIVLKVDLVPKDMNQPIYVYYQLDNFYQNHRRNVKS